MLCVILCLRLARSPIRSSSATRGIIRWPHPPPMPLEWLLWGSVPTDRRESVRRCAAVTGAAGMLGTHLVRALLDAGYEVVCSDIDCDEPQPWGPDGPKLSFADVTRFSELEDWIREANPSVVCHLAAKTDLEWCELNPREAWLNNAVGTSDVARICARSRGTRLVYI